MKTAYRALGCNQVTIEKECAFAIFAPGEAPDYANTGKQAVEIVGEASGHCPTASIFCNCRNCSSIARFSIKSRVTFAYQFTAAIAEGIDKHAQDGHQPTRQSSPPRNCRAATIKPTTDHCQRQ